MKFSRSLSKYLSERKVKLFNEENKYLFEILINKLHLNLRNTEKNIIDFNISNEFHCLLFETEIVVNNFKCI